jgi:DNA-binding XRE family transcriptional regulator
MMNLKVRRCAAGLASPAIPLQHFLTKLLVQFRIQSRRRRALLTQRRLASLIGICRQAVSDIENNWRTWLHRDRHDAHCAGDEGWARKPLPAHIQRALLHHYRQSDFERIKTRRGAIHQTLAK